jgi:hypothetical protein
MRPDLSETGATDVPDRVVPVPMIAHAFAGIRPVTVMVAREGRRIVGGGDAVA